MHGESPVMATLGEDAGWAFTSSSACSIRGGSSASSVSAWIRSAIDRLQA